MRPRAWGCMFEAKQAEARLAMRRARGPDRRARPPPSQCTAAVPFGYAAGDKGHVKPELRFGWAISQRQGALFLIMGQLLRVGPDGQSYSAVVTWNVVCRRPVFGNLQLHRLRSGNMVVACLAACNCIQWPKCAMHFVCMALCMIEEAMEKLRACFICCVS